MSHETIACKLQRVLKKYHKALNSGRPKYGSYMPVMFYGIKGYGRNKWVVAVKIDLDYDDAHAKYGDDQTIVENCIRYLNTPPPSKYGKRRKRKPEYGYFDPHPHGFKVRENEEGQKYIQAFLIASLIKHPKFWDEGPKL